MALEKGPAPYEACTFEAGERGGGARHPQNLAQLVQVEVAVGDIRV